VKVNGDGFGRDSVAVLIAMRPGSRTRRCHRLRRHTGRKGERRSLSGRDYITLVDGVHQLVQAPIVLVWVRLITLVSDEMRDLINARAWLTVFILAAYARAERGRVPMDPRETQPREPRRRCPRPTRRARAQPTQALQYRPDALDAFLAGIGLAIHRPPSTITPKRLVS
jgi:putative transposase